MKSNSKFLACIIPFAALLSNQAHAATYTWARGVAAGSSGAFSWNNSTLNGDTTNGNNWGATASGSFANAVGDVAIVANGTGANNQVINLNQNITIGSIGNIGSTNSSATKTIAAGGAFTLTFDNGASNATINKLTTTNANASVISAPIAIAGNGTLSIANVSTNTITISGGIVSSLTSGTQTLTNTSGNNIISSVVGNGSSGGTVAVNVTGGNMTLNAVNTYTGTTTISSGATLTLGNGALSTSSGISNNGTFTINRANAVVQGTDFSASSIGGSGNLNATGSGLVLTLNTANSYSGTTLIGAAANNSVVRATATGALGSGAIQLDTTGNLSTARLELSGGISLANAINLPGRNNTSIGIENVSGNNTLSGNFNLGTGGSNYTISSSSGLLTLSGNFTPPASGVRDIAFTGSGDTTVDGAISFVTGNTLSVTKQGAGTLTLAGTNTYTGATTVSAGTLFANGSLTSNVSVGAAGTIGGSGSITGNLTLDGASTLSIVDIADALAVSGTVSFSGSGFGINNLTGINWAALDLNTPYTLLANSTDFSSAGLDNFGIANAYDVGGGRSAYFQNGSLAVVVIPEPSAALLGVAGLALFLRRRRQA